tara:strand:+ start:29 stop:259 length:231 start_codon:yes stop_codon:yes gene_type:complete
MGKSLSDQRLVPTRGTRCVTNSMKDEKIKNKNKIKMKKEPNTVFLVILLIFAYILLSKQTPHKPKQTKSNNYTNIL